MRRSVRRTLLRTAWNAALLLIAVAITLQLLGWFVLQPLLVARGDRLATTIIATMDVPIMTTPGGGTDRDPVAPGHPAAHHRGELRSVRRLPIDASGIAHDPARTDRHVDPVHVVAGAVVRFAARIGRFARRSGRPVPRAVRARPAGRWDGRDRPGGVGHTHRSARCAGHRRDIGRGGVALGRLRGARYAAGPLRRIRLPRAGRGGAGVQRLWHDRPRPARLPATGRVRIQRRVPRPGGGRERGRARAGPAAPGDHQPGGRRLARRTAQ